MTLARLIAVLLLGAHAVLAFDGASVLCFGADGHVGVEEAALEHQALGVVASNLGEAPPAVLGKGDVHGPCIDVSLVPVRNADPSSKHLSAHLVGPPPAISVVHTMAPPTFAPMAGTAWDEPPASDSSLACLRSTVLRI